MAGLPRGACGALRCLWLLLLPAAAMRVQDEDLLSLANITDESGSDSKPNLEMEMWAMTLNIGKLTPDGVQEVVEHIAIDAEAQNVRLVVIAMQESGFVKLKEVDGWTVYRTKLQLQAAFTLRTYVLARGLSVSTWKFKHKVLEQHGATVHRDRKADGCREGEESESGGCYGVGIYHECKVGLVCTKGTLATVLEVSPWESEGDWSVSLVVVNSHFGMVRDELYNQMLARSKQVMEALALVNSLSGGFTLPTVMLGDWNFRMSPLGRLKALINSNGGVFPKYLRYTGTALLPDKRTDSMKLAMLNDELIEGPLQEGLYDEVRIAEALVRTGSKELPRELDSYNVLYEDAGMKEALPQYPLTCRYAEGRLFGTVPMAPVPLSELTPMYLKGDVMDYTEGGLWKEFEKAGNSLKVKKGKVQRAPSNCDRAFWSGGLLGSLRQAPGGAGPYRPEASLSAQALLLETDHLPLLARLNLRFSTRREAAWTGVIVKATMVRDAKMAKMLCCCPISSSKGGMPKMVSKGSCVWQEHGKLKFGSVCGLVNSFSKHGLQPISGVLEDNGETAEIRDAAEPQAMCEKLEGAVVSGKDSAGKKVKLIRRKW